MKIIPLYSGYAFQRFSVQLGEYFLRFNLRWLTRYQYYCVDVYHGDTPVVLGKGLHVGSDLFSGLNTPIGRVVLEGKTPTIANLGIDNQLAWYPYEYAS